LLDGALADAAPGTPVSMAMVDVDDFKAINDRWGHAVGDRALIHVAARLEAGSRETDTVFRIGGEEFVVVMPGTTPIAAAAVMQRAAEAVKRTRLDLPSLSISAGIACAPGTAGSAEDLFRVADEALYEAKRSGKDRVVLAG
jgi:diguanylate cyclase (GGDEF)-like protein